MLHVLVGDLLDDPQAILDAVESRKPLHWVVPKTANVGDDVVFFLESPGFVARGVIDTPPEPHRSWQRRYGASVGSITALPAPVPLPFARESITDWGWPHARTHSYTSVSGSIEQQLRSLLDDYQAPFATPSPDTSASRIEGAATSVLLTVYERDPVARQRCVQHYGPVCVVCDFSFEEAFGEQLAGYIHVHHIKAISARGGAYKVDPVRDLRPVCPNCHAVIHRRRPHYSIADVKAMRRHT